MKVLKKNMPFPWLCAYSIFEDIYSNHQQPKQFLAMRFYWFGLSFSVSLPSFFEIDSQLFLICCSSIFGFFILKRSGMSASLYLFFISGNDSTLHPIKFNLKQKYNKIAYNKHVICLRNTIIKTSCKRYRYSIF